MVGLLAAVGGIAAATYITKKKLEKENEEDYYNDWDDLDDDDNTLSKGNRRKPSVRKNSRFARLKSALAANNYIHIVLKVQRNTIPT